MAKVPVYELARELGIGTDVIMARLDHLDEAVCSTSSTQTTRPVGGQWVRV